MNYNFILPNSWREVKVWQYQDLVNLNIDGKGIFEKYIEYLSILTETEVDEWEDMDIEDISNIIKNIQWLKKAPSSNYKTNIGKFTLINLNTLTLGEYIDIEHLIDDGVFKNFHKILAILYKQTKLDEWGEIRYEPYNYNLGARSELFLDLSIDDVYGIINYYNQFKEMFIKTYSNLFNPNIPEEDLDPEEELTAEDKREIEKEKERAKWSWESLIYNICQGDLTKYDKVLDLPLIFVFNQITFKKLFNIE